MPEFQIAPNTKQDPLPDIDRNAAQVSRTVAEPPAQLQNADPAAYRVADGYRTTNATAATATGATVNAVQAGNVSPVQVGQAEYQAPTVVGQGAFLAPTAYGTATASTAGVDTRGVGENELAATQLARITANDSPLMVRARQEGLLRAGARGLQNSSIAASNAMGAMVDRATPIALQDAATYGRTASENMAAQNAARLLNAQLLTNTSIQNAGFLSQAAIADTQSRTSITNQNSQNVTSGAIADLQSRTTTANNNADLRTRGSIQDSLNQVNINTTNASVGTQANIATGNNLTEASISNARDQTATSQFNANWWNTAQKDDFTANWQRFMQDDQQLFEDFMKGRDETFRTNFQELLGDQAKELLEIENANKVLINNSAIAAQLWDGYQRSVAALMSNPELSPAEMQTAMSMLNQTLRSGFQVMDAVGVTGLDDLTNATGNTAGTGWTFNPGGFQGYGGYADLVTGQLVPNDFNPQAYIANNPQVREAFDAEKSKRGTIEQFAAFHYATIGRSQNLSYAGSNAGGDAGNNNTLATLPTNFREMTKEAQQQWLLSNTRGVTLPEGYNSMSDGDRIRWLRENHPALSAAGVTGKWWETVEGGG